MKKLLFFCGLIIFSGSIMAQESVDVVDSTLKPAVAIPKAYELASAQKKAWQAIGQQWLKNEYPKILKQQKLKMNCNGCENIYLDAVFSIDAQGRLSHYDVVNSKKCADKFSKALETKFVAWFFTVQFPPELYGISFEVRLGTGLMC